MKTTVNIVNSDDGPLRLVLEPWGRQYDLESGAAQRLDFSGPDAGMIEVVARSGEITIYGWTGSTVHDGVHPQGPPVPPTP